MGSVWKSLAALTLTGVLIVACASPAVEDQVEAPPVVQPTPIPPPAPPVVAPAPSMAMESYATRAQGVTGRMAGDARMAPPRASYNPETENRENYRETTPNPVKAVATDPVSTFSIDVDTASYANVRRMINTGNLPPRDAVRVEELINYFDYDYALPANRTTPFSTTVSVVPSPWATGKQLVHIGLQGYDIAPAQRPPLNLVLLIDTSGSMGPPNRLPLAKQAFRMLIDDLGPRDKVSMVVYAGSAGAVLEPTSGAEKAKILAALDNLSSGGSTAGGQGLALAYTLAERNFNRNAVNRIILASDGDFNVGITNPAELEGFVTRKRESGVYLSILGFGGGNYNDALMQRLAQKGNGTAAYIDTLAEARKVLHDQAQSALLPIADDVKIQVEFNPTRVAEYRLIGYETRMLNREDFNNDRVDAGEIGAGANVTAIYEITPVGGRTLNDPLRYQSPRPQAAPAGEIAFLRIRWKPPGASESKLIERPITARDMHASIAAAPESTRFATAVAGYGQLLRGDPYLDRSYGYDQVIELAQGARGADPFGWRAEFVQLARAAKAGRASPDPRQTGTSEYQDRTPPRLPAPLHPPITPPQKK
ncbi:MAG: VWA domain-containing protein [Alphaproteobacteria bacterium]|nr:VWA domain-containing protein [Alphaproteobacteria bacterium]